MKIYKNLHNQNLIAEIQAGAVGVLPTDTIYGLVASARNPESVKRLYEIKGRKPEKPFIVLISDISDLTDFGIILDEKISKIIKGYWPGPNTFVLDSPSKDLTYLNRGSDSLAFRLPNKEDLLELIKQTGPLVAPSANPEGQKPSENIDDAINYFLDKADFYVDAGKIIGKASNIYSISNDGLKQIR
jgi:L-threonylcarbamoyladenylate synthase